MGALDCYSKTSGRFVSKQLISHFLAEKILSRQWQELICFKVFYIFSAIILKHTYSVLQLRKFYL